MDARNQGKHCCCLHIRAFETYLNHIGLKTPRHKRLLMNLIETSARHTTGRENQEKSQHGAYHPR